jgi:hypothetical protein
MSITGDIYNIDQSLTGDGITDLELNSLLVDGTFQKVDASYFNNISSPIQTQLNNLSTLISNNANLNYAFTNTNNDFTSSLNKFVSIECSNNIQTLTINNTPANYYEGLTQNIQQKLNSLTAGSPVNGVSATISVGTTTTLSPGSNASVTNSGTNLDAVFNFGIPRGLQGNPGNPGNNGITPTFQINPIVDTLVSGSTPYVTITQNPINNYILKFGLVQGIQGSPGNPGNNGITPTFSLNPIIDNLVPGSTPYVTITQNPLDANNYILKFGLVQGLKGEKGDKGDTGDTPSSGDILSILTAALGGISIVTLAGYVIKLQSEVAGLITSVGILQGQVGILDGEVSTLVSKTIGLSHNITLGRSNFNNTLTITNLLLPLTNAVELNATIPSNFNLGIITTGLAAGAIGCTSVITTGDISVGGVFDVTGESNFAGLATFEGETNFAGLSTFEGETNFTGAVTIEGETNFAGAVTMQSVAVFEAEANFAGAVTIEGLLSVTGYDMELNGGSIIQAQITNEETGLPTPISSPNTFFDTNFVGNITQTNLFPDNPLHTPPTTTLLATSVESLSVTETSTLYNLDVIGPSINIGDNNENNVINIGNNQSTITLEGDSISIGVASVANTINIGNSFTTLTLRSNANQPINIENIMDQMDIDINQILNEINGF